MWQVQRPTPRAAELGSKAVASLCGLRERGVALLVGPRLMSFQNGGSRRSNVGGIRSCEKTSCGSHLRPPEAKVVPLCSFTHPKQVPGTGRESWVQTGGVVWFSRRGSLQKPSPTLGGFGKDVTVCQPSTTLSCSRTEWAGRDGLSEPVGRECPGRNLSLL